MMELPTGNAARGLGSGQAWYRVPIWIQKSWGPWTSYGGGGYAVNRAPGMRNYFFAGWLLQRDVSASLSLGAEVFSQGEASNADRGTTLFNFGGYYSFTSDFSLLFSAGHSIGGVMHRIVYFGLYRTWGPAGSM